MDIRPIRTDEDHRAALEEIDRLWGAPRGTPEGDRIDILATLVEAYENEHHPVPDADPVEILHFAIEDLGRSQAELAELLGSRARASEILNRRRHLTLAQIRLISEAWHLPIGALAAPYRLDRTAA
jgi:HTH-type transcriptional regulator / antitoxin HigA